MAYQVTNRDLLRTVSKLELRDVLFNRIVPSYDAIVNEKREGNGGEGFRD